MSWSRSGAPDPLQLRRRHRVGELVRRHVGLVHEFIRVPPDVDGPQLEVVAAQLDNITRTLPHARSADGHDLRNSLVGGAGAHPELEIAWLKAVVEAAERYATMVFAEDELLVASPSQLGDAALDLDRLPRCSDRELADDRCPLRRIDPTRPLRWCPAISLVSGRSLLVPAVMVHLYLRPTEHERFWIPISTGVAAHTSLPAALLGGLCEVIERDAISLTWLTRRPLPRIDLAGKLPEAARAFLNRLSPCSSAYYFFDATTDLGVPTVLALQVDAPATRSNISVSCATSLGAADALSGAIRESAQTRVALRRDVSLPADVADFSDLLHGAAYYAGGNGRGDFDFLLDSGRATTLADLPRGLEDGGDDPTLTLQRLVARLGARGLDVLAVDLTPNELRERGLWVVRVLVPELMPLSFIHRARYLGTPRLWTHWRSEGFGPVEEALINPCPMPFA
jgi:ribosomal protein S12 methylthiotransferase accessory factor